MAVERVTVFPCGGIGDPVSSVTRLAGYLLAEDLLPGKVNLVSIPPVITGVPEESEWVQRYPVIVLDGCAHRCGSSALNLVGITPAARLFTPRVRSETKEAIGRRRPFPEVSGQRLAKSLAERAAVIARQMLEDPDYTFAPQTISVNLEGLHDESLDIENALGYEEVETGCFRCSGMCPFEMTRDPAIRRMLDAEVEEIGSLEEFEC